MTIAVDLGRKAAKQTNKQNVGTDAVVMFNYVWLELESMYFSIDSKL